MLHPTEAKTPRKYRYKNGKVNTFVKTNLQKLFANMKIKVKYNSKVAPPKCGYETKAFRGLRCRGFPLILVIFSCIFRLS